MTNWKEKLTNLQTRPNGIMDWDQYRKSAVLIPLLRRDHGYTVLFQVRARELRSQPGEICFPGGRIEEKEDARQAVLRETCEELLIEKDQIEIIAAMDMLITSGDSVICPYLGELHNYRQTFSPAEVDHVFEVPLTFFLETEPREYIYTTRVKPDDNFPWHLVPGGKKYPWREGRQPVYFYEYKHYIIWGLTARIMKAAAELLK